jgi:hypothetical protein
MTMAFDPHSASHVVVGTQTQGVYESFDGGSSWQPSDATLSPWPTSAGTFIDIRSLLFDPQDSAILPERIRTACGLVHRTAHRG